MNWDPAIVAAAITAVAAFIFGQISDLVKNRRDFRHRWDEHAYSAAQEFVAATRRLAHLAAEESTTGNELSDAHARVRITCQQLSVIVDLELATLARKVQRQAYALVKTLRSEPDPRPGPKQPRERFNDSLDEFYAGLRKYFKLEAHPARLLED